MFQKHFYCRYLRKDKEELEALRQAKLLEEEKAQFAVSVLVEKLMNNLSLVIYLIRNSNFFSFTSKIIP